MSTFSGLNVARTGMEASQKAIDLTGHNIANANTEGYTRQRLNTVSIETGSKVMSLATSLPDTGGGVKIVAVEQIRSKFLDGQYRVALREQEELQARNDGMENMEMLFNEMNSTGLSAQLDGFMTGVEELSKHPSDLGIRTAVVQNAIQLSETFNYLSGRLSDLQSGLDSEVVDTVDQINDLANEIAELNERIYKYENGGQTANELRDQRNLKIDELAGLAGIESTTTPMGKTQITLGDRLLVDHDQTNSINAAPTIENPIQDGDMLHGIIWEDGESVAAGGKLKGLLIARDGSTADEAGIAYYNGKLDILAAGIGEAFNAVHEQGWTLPDISKGIASQTGVPLFVSVGEADGVVSELTAGSIRINPDILKNPRLIAASSAEISGNGAYGNNDNALSLSGVFDQQDIQGIGEIKQFIASFVGSIGSEMSNVSSQLAAKTSVAANIEERRQSVSGVSINEEMTNLMKFQQSYNAAARVITAIDENLDTLINRMGVVGR